MYVVEIGTFFVAEFWRKVEQCSVIVEENKNKLSTLCIGMNENWKLFDFTEEMRYFTLKLRFL